MIIAVILVNLSPTTCVRVIGVHVPLSKRAYETEPGASPLVLNLDAYSSLPVPQSQGSATTLSMVVFGGIGDYVCTFARPSD